jgi:hypothetical protein
MPFQEAYLVESAEEPEIECMLGCVGSVVGELTLTTCQMPLPKGLVSHFLASLSCKSSTPVAPMGSKKFAPVTPMDLAPEALMGCEGEQAAGSCSTVQCMCASSSQEQKERKV